MSLVRILSLVSLAACLQDPRGGTAVGNPGDADAKASRLDPTLQLEDVVLPVQGLQLLDCDGSEVWREGPLLLDGLSPSPERVVVPGGRFCGLALALSGPVEVTGTTPGGAAFSVALSLDSLEHTGPVTIDGQHLLFELPLPLEASALEALGPEVVVPEDDPLALEWALAATSAVRLWEDTDEDGQLSLADRELVPRPLDTGALPAYAESANDCGCAQSRGQGGWLLLAALGLSLRRRPSLG